MPDENGTIIPFPDFEKLKKDVEKLRTELSMLLLERDELLFVECQNIETAYMLALGHLEYKAYELHCAVLRLQRKAELIQAQKNRQEKISLPDIESALDEEFAEYQAKLEEQIDRMNAALKRNQGEILCDEEARELKKLYRALVKALHPDLHPDNSETQVTLFRNAVSAYKNGDLETLRLISAMVSDPALPEQEEDSMALLGDEKERLTHLLKTLRERIAEIKSTYPYTMKPIVQSKEKMAEKKTELEASISQLNDVLAFYTAKIEDMLR